MMGGRRFRVCRHPRAEGEKDPFGGFASLSCQKRAWFRIFALIGPTGGDVCGPTA